jgi:hypothetical protein
MRSSSIVSATFALAALCSPTFAQDANEDQIILPADPQQNGWFGYSISVDGGRAVIGSPLKDDVAGASGAAYVFDRFGPGNWVETAKLAPNTLLEQGDLFGASVSISGSRIAVGMIGEDDATLQAGAVVIFEDFGGLWFESAKLFASDAAQGDFFGEPVVIDGNRVVATSQFDSDNGIESGSAYVFEESGGVWTEVAKLKPLDGAAMDHFGASMDFEGDRVLIGAPDNDDGSMGAGSAYYFQRVPNGTWRQLFKFVAPDPFTNDSFGFAVSLDGDFAYISAVGQDLPGVNQGGEVYVYQRITASNWQLITRFNAATPIANGFFGTAIDVEGARAVTTAWQEGVTLDNAAYVHDLQSGGTWLQSARIRPTDTALEDIFGRSVAIDGDEALIGAMNAANPFTDGGKAYDVQLGTLYHGAPTISATTGGTQNLLLRAGQSKANQVFVMLGSASGTFPGTFDPLSGVTVPLNFDAYFLQLLNTGGAGLVSPFFGFLDANGQASATFTIPPVNPSFVGLSLDHAYVMVDLFGTTLASGASNPAHVTIVP